MPKEPQFKAYQEVKELAVPESLMYFSRWLDIINLEQSTININQSVGLEMFDQQKKTAKEEGMRITDLQEVKGGDDPVLTTFDIKLERPYFALGKKNGDILAGSYVNLHTKNSISFTKGLVLKKHLITKRSSKKSQNADEDAEDDEVAESEQTGASISASGAASSTKSKGTASTSLKKKNKSNIYLQYIVQFSHINRQNFSVDSLGGLDFKEEEWSIEQETFSTYQFNIMRNNLQNLCTNLNKH